jgi:hypothetical protein
MMMQVLFSAGSATRRLQVEKNARRNINTNLVPYTIDKNGIEIYLNISLFRENNLKKSFLLATLLILEMRAK